MCVWRLRDYKRTETLGDELSGVCGKRTLLELCGHASSDTSACLFVHLDAQTRRNQFWPRCENRLIPIHGSGTMEPPLTRPALDGLQAPR